MTDSLALVLHSSALSSEPVDGKTSSSSSSSRNTEFTGLYNQGGTCYMNSLLQTMFMTPEFRAALYRWQHNAEKDEAKEESIAYQLQLLFGQLQLSNSRYGIETKSLTKSFGWNSEQGWEQQDVQELCRILFDTIDEAWKDTNNADMMDKLYAGEMQNYVYIPSNPVNDQYRFRSEKFLDIQLVIQPSSSSSSSSSSSNANSRKRKPFSSISSCLDHLLKPQSLDDDCKYELIEEVVDPISGISSKIVKRVSAIIGTRFKTFPYILTFHLKRFTYEGKTFNRVKINSRVAFPSVLNMKKYLLSDDDVTRMVTSVDDDDDDVPGLEDAFGVGYDDYSNDEKKNDNNDDDDDGFIYELYSVLVHSGGGYGGHYYAYIKQLDCKSWFKFNDSRVTVVENEDEVWSSFGNDDDDDESKRHGRVMKDDYGANAYMLLYRRIDVKENTALPSKEDVPAEIANAVAVAHQKEMDDVKVDLDRGNMVGIRVFVHRDDAVDVNDSILASDSSSSSSNNVTSIYDLDSEFSRTRLEYDISEVFFDRSVATIGDVRQHVYDEIVKRRVKYKEEHELSPDVDGVVTRSKEVPLDCVRLRKFSEPNFTSSEIYDDSRKRLIELYFYNHCSIIVDIRTPSMPFEGYITFGFNINIELVSHDDLIGTRKNVRLANDAKLDDLLACAKTTFGLTDEEVDKLSCVKVVQSMSSTRIDALSDKSKRLKYDYNIFDGYHLYLESVAGDAEAVHTKCINSIKIYLVLDLVEKDVRVDQRMTISDFRDFVCKQFQLEGKEFKIRRLSQNGTELVESSTKGTASWNLSTLGVFSCSKVYVTLERPLKPGEVNSRIYIYDSTSSSSLSHVTGVVNIGFLKSPPTDEMNGKIVDAIRAMPVAPAKDFLVGYQPNEWPSQTTENILLWSGLRFKEYVRDWTMNVGNLPVAGSMQVAELRRGAHALLISKFPDLAVTANQIRIRDLCSSRLGVILRDGLTISHSCLNVYDGREFLVEWNKHCDDDDGNNEMMLLKPRMEGQDSTMSLLQTQLWDPITGTLGVRFEIAISLGDTLARISRMLTSIYPSINHFEAMILPSYASPSYADLILSTVERISRLSSSWSKLTNRIYGERPRDAAWWLADGDVMIIREFMSEERLVQFGAVWPADKLDVLREERKKQTSGPYPIGSSSSSSTHSYMSSSSSSSTPLPYVPKKEKGIVIKRKAKPVSGNSDAVTSAVVVEDDGANNEDDSVAESKQEQ